MMEKISAEITDDMEMYNSDKARLWGMNDEIR